MYKKIYLYKTVTLPMCGNKIDLYCGTINLLKPGTGTHGLVLEIPHSMRNLS